LKAVAEIAPQVVAYGVGVRKNKAVQPELPSFDQGDRRDFAAIWRIQMTGTPG
jgi:hypothetical protein